VPKTKDFNAQSLTTHRK